MKPKKKLALSLSILVFLLILGASITVTFLILANQTSSNNTSYNAFGVVGETSAKAYLGDESHILTTNGKVDGQAVITFDGSEKEDKNQKFMLPNIQKVMLSKDIDYIIFEYKFKNTSQDDDWLISLKSDNMQCDNLIITVGYSLISLSKENYYTGIANINEQTSIYSNFDNNAVKNLPVEAQSEMFVYLKIEIKNQAKNARFAGDLVWTLNSRAES